MSETFRSQEDFSFTFEAISKRWEDQKPGCPAPDAQTHGAPENGGDEE